MKSKLSNFCGFTLTELMIVVSIIGILAAVGYPALKAIKHDHALSSEGDILNMNIRYLQQLAVTESTSYTLSFDASGSKYTLNKASDGTEIRAHILENSVVFSNATSAGLSPGASSSLFMTVSAPNGIISGSAGSNILIPLRTGTDTIYVKITPGRKIEISWSP